MATGLASAICRDVAWTAPAAFYVKWWVKGVGTGSVTAVDEDYVLASATVA